MKHTTRRSRPPVVDRAALQAACDAFNAKYPVGTPVAVRRDNGESLITKTRSTAWVIPSDAALVMVDGIDGGYSLSRVSPIGVETAP